MLGSDSARRGFRISTIATPTRSIDQDQSCVSGSAHLLGPRVHPLWRLDQRPGLAERRVVAAPWGAPAPWGPLSANPRPANPAAGRPSAYRAAPQEDNAPPLAPA